tara:strand:+ start:3072 stop:3989 length:918 start_codon:yes stop_codon:yes gene_type:complete
MGYLNNSSRVLDAILTKKGREILSSGGDFNVTKFALGDDEIDYALWDTSHTSGTDYYGAAIDNLPALEPFNDPSEIMKYKLVTRTWPGTEAMAKLKDASSTASNLLLFKWYTTADESSRTSVSPVRPETVPDGQGGERAYQGAWPASSIGGTALGDFGFDVEHVPNMDFGNIDYPIFAGDNPETFTVTLLDSSVAVLAPERDGNTTTIASQGSPDESPTSGMIGSDFFWMPFVDNVQHLSQTFSGLVKDGGKLTIPNDGRELRLYSKKINATATTTVIISGDMSGAVIEFPVTITYYNGSSSADS